MNGLKRLTRNLVRKEWKTKKTLKMGVSFSVPSAASVLAPSRRSRVLLGTPFPGSSTNQKGKSSGCLPALHPKGGKGTTEAPKANKQ